MPELAQPYTASSAFPLPENALPLLTYNTCQRLGFQLGTASRSCEQGLVPGMGVAAGLLPCGGLSDGLAFWAWCCLSTHQGRCCCV
jgi:hypothetical protein